MRLAHRLARERGRVDVRNMMGEFGAGRDAAEFMALERLEPSGPLFDAACVWKLMQACWTGKEFPKLRDVFPQLTDDGDGPNL